MTVILLTEDANKNKVKQMNVLAPNKHPVRIQTRAVLKELPDCSDL